MSENKKDELTNEEIASLAKSLDMSEEELQDLLKSEDEEEKEEESEDEEKEQEEETEKSEVKDIEKSIKENLLKLKELKKKDEVIEKSGTDDLMKSFELSISDKLEKAVSGIKETFEKSLESLQTKFDELEKSINLIGSQSQGTKGVRFNSFLQKSGDSTPISKDGKTIISAKDRESISNAMVDVIEKSREDEDLQKSMTADLINYQGSNELSERAVKNLNKHGYLFDIQAQE